jgi:glycosyltransferase involved in cell wall biosynthesis
MLALLERHAPIRVFDRARRASRGGWLLQQLLLLMRFFVACCVNRRLTLYLALSGGKGQLFDAVYLLVGRLFWRPQFIHHHSFAYIDSTTFINKATLLLARNQTHIVLSQAMGQGLARRYGLDARKVMVLSNAAFLSEPVEGSRALPTTSATAPVQIGFLSNITFDKGFVEFFDVLARLRSLEVSYQAYLAGPVAPEAGEVFERLRAACADTEYVGGVYGEAKDRFYRQLDILLFPTKYANEADPLVIHEALRCGVYVIACNRGAIPDTLRNGAGLVFPRESFVDRAAECICVMSADRGKLLQGRRMALEQARRLRVASSLALERALNAICLGECVEATDERR